MRGRMKTLAHRYKMSGLSKMAYYGRPLTGLLLAAALVAAIACSSDEEVVPTSAPEAATSVPSESVATAAPQASAAVEAPAATGPHGTLTVALSDIGFPATVPSTTAVRTGMFLQQWGVYETPFVWAIDGPGIEP